MLSLDRCRRVLGESCALDNQELSELRTQFYDLAQMVIVTFERGPFQAHAGTTNFDSVITDVPASERDGIEERAAILQADAGCTRDEAERRAFHEYLERRRGPSRGR